MRLPRWMRDWWSRRGGYTVHATLARDLDTGNLAAKVRTTATLHALAETLMENAISKTPFDLTVLQGGDIVRRCAGRLERYDEVRGWVDVCGLADELKTDPLESQSAAEISMPEKVQYPDWPASNRSVWPPIKES